MMKSFSRVKKQRAESPKPKFRTEELSKEERGKLSCTTLLVGFIHHAQTSKSYQMILQYINALNASTKWRVVLASKSPRRQEILRNLGIEYDVVASTFEENISKEGVKGHEYAIFTAGRKRKRFIIERREKNKNKRRRVISS